MEQLRREFFFVIFISRDMVAPDLERREDTRSITTRSFSGHLTTMIKEGEFHRLTSVDYLRQVGIIIEFNGETSPQMRRVAAAPDPMQFTKQSFPIVIFDSVDAHNLLHEICIEGVATPGKN